MRRPRKLPDLLIPLVALAPVSARAAGTEALPELGFSLLRVAGSLVLVLALLLALAALFRRARNVARSSHRGPRLETVDRLDVGARREIRVVRAGERTLVVGITEERMELLCELDDVAPEADTGAPRGPVPRPALAISS